MIVRTREGNQIVSQGRTNYVIQPGSWDANIMGWLGVTQWSSPSSDQWMRNVEDTAVACGVRLVSESIGSMVGRVYTGDALERQPLYNAPMADVFQNPCDGVSSFDFWGDQAAAVELDTAAFMWKVKDRAGTVVELLPLDPDYFEIKGQPHMRTVHGYVDGKRIDVTQDVTVIRSWAPRPQADGVSTPLMHSSTLDYARSYAKYTGRWFDLDGSVSQVIQKGPTDRNDRLSMAAGWMRARKERGNVAILWGDAELKQMGSTLQDAQASDIEMGIVKRVARAWRILPASFLLATVNPERYPNLEVPTGLFYRFSLLHRLRRIERAVSADRDIFPDRSQYLRFDATEFLRADTQTLASIAHNMRQDGSANADEERALVLGWPPLPDGKGKEYQQTPVGGGANMPPPAAATPSPEAMAAAEAALSALYDGHRNGDEDD